MPWELQKIRWKGSTRVKSLLVPRDWKWSKATWSVSRMRESTLIPTKTIGKNKLLQMTTKITKQKGKFFHLYIFLDQLKLKWQNTSCQRWSMRTQESIYSNPWPSWSQASSWGFLLPSFWEVLWTRWLLLRQEELPRLLRQEPLRLEWLQRLEDLLPVKWCFGRWDFVSCCMEHQRRYQQCLYRITWCRWRSLYKMLYREFQIEALRIFTN